MPRALLVHMARTFALAVGITAWLSVLLGVGCSTGGGLSCMLGGGCTQTQICMGIAGCTSNCQCLDGTWQAPCPTEVPQSGSACTAAGATCGYVTQAIACGGSVDCYCQGGAWSCSPTCVTPTEDASTDVGASADACPSSGCTGSCLNGAQNVSHLVDGCLVWQCCVPDGSGFGSDAGDGSTE
jgi:hypothetical protein